MKSRENEKHIPWKRIALAALVAVGLPSAAPEPLTFTANRIEKWSDINFTMSDQTWAVKNSSVNIFAQTSRNQVWEGEIESLSGETKRVTCTSGTTLPASGGSYFQANCQLR